MTATISNSKRPNFTVSIDVKTVYDRLIKASVGDTIKYEEMEQLVGRSVRNHGAWILASARRRAFAQNNMLFGVVTKVGVKRLSDPEIISTAQESVTRIHRMSQRAARRLTAIQNFDALSSEDKTRHNLNVSALALLSHITREGQLKKLEAKVTAATRTLPLQQTLAAFKES